MTEQISALKNTKFYTGADTNGDFDPRYQFRSTKNANWKSTHPSVSIPPHPPSSHSNRKFLGHESPVTHDFFAAFFLMGGVGVEAKIPSDFCGLAKIIFFGHIYHPNFQKSPLCTDLMYVNLRTRTLESPILHWMWTETTAVESGITSGKSNLNLEPKLKKNEKIAVAWPQFCQASRAKIGIMRVLKAWKSGPFFANFGKTNPDAAWWKNLQGVACALKLVQKCKRYAFWQI